MTLDDLTRLLDEVTAEADAAIAASASIDALRSAESRITKGPLAEALKSIKQFSPEERGSAGRAVNEAKKAVRQRFKTALDQLRSADVAGERKKAATFDPTLPPPVTQRGSLHPVTAVQREVERIFRGLGFAVVGGPEMETEYYNFEALNIPEMHPARDAQDTFWIEEAPGRDPDGGGWLLRTHTSPCQVRAMLRWGAPLRVIAPGRCFRYEAIDASHENTFFQVEGLLIDRGISVAHLIAFMKLLLDEVFGREVKVRLRPGFFPFVEPGFECDMSCEICDGRGKLADGTGCATCKRSGWIEIIPCGMVHPNVLRHGKIDPREYTGFAFGLGLTRLAMMKYGIRDIRIMNSGDLRGLVHPARLCGSVISRAGD